MPLTRRRFLTISAAAVAAGPATARPHVRQFSGTALGARATLSLAHPDGEEIAARVFAEIDRLEDIFSLYRAQSSLSRLNATGALEAPPFELLECLSVCTAVNTATRGAFDPTVQPLWVAYARAHAAGRSPSVAEVLQARRITGWRRVALSSAEVSFAAPGMALTLNGIAQGYIADRVARLLRRDGLTNILVNTGELHALGGVSMTDDWFATLAEPGPAGPERVALRDQALASSAPLGTTFDRDGMVGHIIDPGTGMPAMPNWRLVSVLSGSAAVADALSTAACLLDRPQIEKAVASFPGSRLVAAI